MSDELIVNDKQAMNALKKNGSNIVTAILAVLAIFFGWQFYQKNYAKIDTAAADSYTNIATKSDNLALLAQNPELKTQADAQQKELFTDIDALASTHGDTVYAWQALMTKARVQADKDDYKGAIDSLNKALAVKIDDEGLLAISRLQLASLQLADNQVDTALATIKQPFPTSFEPSRLEIEGDILLAKKDNDGAKASYQKAWELLAERHENRALLKLKMQSLGLEPANIEPKNQVVADNTANNAGGVAVNAESVETDKKPSESTDNQAEQADKANTQAGTQKSDKSESK